MRVTHSERARAECVSAAVDELIRDPDAQAPQLNAEDEALLSTARQLARQMARLGPVDPALEHRLLPASPARTAVPCGPAYGADRPRRLSHLRPGWVAAAVAIGLLAVMLLTPLGHTAVASFMAVFKLGRTEVHITPMVTSTATGAAVEVQPTAVQQSLTLAEARKLPFAILEPAVLPPGYSLRRVTGYTYPDLPAWVPQPFSVELVYGDSSGHEFSLHLYPISLGEGNQLNVSRLNLEAAPIRDVQDVQVNGQPGVLLQLGKATDKAVWQEVVWEQGNLLLSLSSSDLSTADMLAVARSVK